jgi:hypothetical protein
LSSVNNARLLVGLGRKFSVVARFWRADQQSRAYQLADTHSWVKVLEGSMLLQTLDPRTAEPITSHVRDS